MLQDIVIIVMLICNGDVMSRITAQFVEKLVHFTTTLKRYFVMRDKCYHDCCLLSGTCCLLSIACRLVPVACYLLLVACYLLLISCCVLRVACFVLPAFG